jgi:hypothetical protein
VTRKGFVGDQSSKSELAVNRAYEGSGAATDFGSTPTTQAGGLDKYSLVNGTGS